MKIRINLNIIINSINNNNKIKINHFNNNQLDLVFHLEMMNLARLTINIHSMIL